MRKSLRGLAVGGVIVLAIAQLLGAVLSISSFEKTYRESLLSKYRILTGELRRQVERDVNFGRPIYLLGGVSKIFDGVRELDRNIGDLYVCLPDGKVLYSTDPEAVGKLLGAGTLPGFPEASPAEEEEPVSSGFRGSTFVSAPARYDGNALVGTVHARFDDSVISNRIRALAAENIGIFVPTLAAAVILLLILLLGSEAAAAKGKLRLSAGARGTAAIIVALLAAQIPYAYLNDRFFKRSYVELFEDNVDSVSTLLKTDLDRVLGYGVSVDRLKGADALLEKNRARVREAESLAILDPSGRPLYAAMPDGVFSVLEGTPWPAERAREMGIEQSAWRRVSPLGPAASPTGYLMVEVNRSLIEERLRDALMDVLTVLVVSLVFGFELARMLSVFLGDEPGGTEAETAEAAEDASGRRSLQIVRVVAFVFFFAALVPLSFLPAYIEQVYLSHPVPIFGLSPSTIIGIPIAAYMLGITLFIPLVGFLSTRMSTKKIFFISGGLFTVGTLASAFPVGIAALAFTRFIAGLGYGGMVINGSNLVVTVTTERNRSAGFGSWSAGFASATICAISIGGVIVNRLGHRAGLLVATGSGLLLLLLIAFYVESGAPKQKVESEAAKFGELFQLFRNKSIVANLLFSSIPFSLAYIGIFQYILPLYMGSSGISASNIGRILTVYGLISLGTPLISRLADHMKNEKTIIIVGNLITGLALFGFFIASRMNDSSASYLLLIFVLAGMGIGGMMVDASEESFLTSSDEARRMGEAKFLSLYMTFEKITSIAVPFIAGLLVAAFGYNGSLGAIGAFTILGVAAFALLARNMRSGQ
jgi:predicted MFS family arabinose efflux permease